MVNKEKESGSSESGAYLVEIALVLPLLLALVAFCLFVILAVDQVTALATAVSRAGSAAISRSDPGKIRNIAAVAGAIPQLDSSGPISSINESSDLFPLFYRGVELSEAQLFYESGVDSPISGMVYGEDVGELNPAIFRYMLAYVHIEMSALLGARVRYPCNPDADDGAGCLLCRFVNPRVIGGTDDPICADIPNTDPDYYCAGSGDYDFDEQTVGTHLHMSCRYAPSNIIIRLLSGMFSSAGMGEVTSRQGIIQRDKIIDMRNEQWIGIMGEG